MRPDLPRTVGFFGAAAIMVGVAIGSGIFRTPTQIAQQTGSPTLVLLLWTVGGVLSLFGALTFAELAVKFPHSGGVYVFLREGFGPAVAFVFGWTYMLISKPLAAAGIAVIFAEHLNPLLNIDPKNHVASAITTSIMLILLTALNVRGMRLGSGVATVLTSIKVFALLAIVLLALILWKGSAANFHDQAMVEPKAWWIALAPIMAGVLWTYDGWSDVGSIAGEVRDPQRMLPRIYLVGTLMLAGLYVAVNAVYLWLMPLKEMAASETVAPMVMQRLVGEGGSVAVTLLILVSTLGSTHGSIITGARVSFAQARDGLLFRFLGRVHGRYQTPAIALWMQCALSCAAVWAYGFEELAGGFVFTMWIFYGAAAAVIFIVRRREAKLVGEKSPECYRCWGYPYVPMLFLLAAFAMTVLSIMHDPVQTGVWLLVLGAGFPVYFVWSRLYGAGNGVENSTVAER